MAEEGGGGTTTMGVQKVAVMRHGDRIDASEPLWALQAERPWDPPLTDCGKIRAWTTGKKLRSAAAAGEFPIHRVIVSPFLRCLQTACEVVKALCAVVDAESHLLLMDTNQDALAIDPSRVKVHIELGLCEVMSSKAMRLSVPAKDGNWFPDISELETIFPDGTVDRAADSICNQLPLWEEPMSAARTRYANIISALADKFPRDNLLLVTHGEAVGVSVSAFAKGLEVFDVEYCALSYLERRISLKGSQTESFKMLTEDTKSGVSYYSEREQMQIDNVP